MGGVYRGEALLMKLPGNARHHHNSGTGLIHGREGGDAHVLFRSPRSSLVL